MALSAGTIVAARGNRVSDVHIKISRLLTYWRVAPNIKTPANNRSRVDGVNQHHVLPEDDLLAAT